MSHRIARAGGCLVVLIAALACVACRDSSWPVSAAQRQRPAPIPPHPPEPVATFTLEFDAPDDMLQRRPDGTFAVSAFQVGFFDGSDLARTFEIPRSAAQFTGSRVRLQVPIISVPPGTGTRLDVRVRGLASGPLGPWSASAGSVSASVETPLRRNRERAQPNAARQQARARQVSLAQLGEFPELKAALPPLLRGSSEEATVGACATVQDLGLSVVLSRKHDLPLIRVCEALRTRSNDAIAAALKAMAPSMDVGAELREARAEARRQFAGRRK